MSKYPKNHAQSGFAVPLTLVLLGVLSLSLWGALHVLEGLSRDLEYSRTRQALAVAGSSLEARVGFLLLSEPLESRGISIGAERVEPLVQLVATEQPAESLSANGADGPSLLWADGRVYKFVDPVSGQPLQVSLQDEAGLFMLGNSGAPETERLLTSLSGDEALSRSLAAALADFVDPDDLTRLNGAERNDYDQAGLPGPLNRSLEQPTQIWSVLGWKDAFDPPQRKELLALSSTSLLANAQNINTAPAPVLQAWFGLSDEQAAQVIQAREDRPLSGPLAITAITGVPIDYEPTRVYSFPSRRFLLTIKATGANGATLTRTSLLTLAAQSAERPIYLNSQKLRRIRQSNGEAYAVRDEKTEDFPSSRLLLPD